MDNNDKQERDFQGVWIPKEIWLNEELTLQEKALLVEIKSLDNKDGCYAKNNHFMKFLGLGERRIQDIIKKLISGGYLTSRFKYKEGTKEIEKRTLRVNNIKFYGIKEGESIPNHVVQESAPRGAEICEGNCTTPGAENCVVSNTIYNIKKKKGKTEFDLLIESYTNNQMLKDNIYEFIKSRKAIKKALTTLALKKILNELNKLTTSDERKMQILDNSIMNGWSGVFQLKDEIVKQNNTWEEGYF